LWLRALASLLLALERRRIAHPEGLGLRRFFKVGLHQEFAIGEMGFRRQFAQQQF
jgi:hypothetical protein